MRIVFGLPILLVTLGTACGDDQGGSATLPESALAAVGAYSTHASGDSVVIAINLDPDPSNDTEISVDVVDGDGSLLATLEPGGKGALGCPPVEGEQWRFFTMTGPLPDAGLLNINNQIRVTATDQGESTKLLVDMPDLQCEVLE